MAIFHGIYGGLMESNGIYSLVMTNSLPWYRWPIEIDGLPFLNMVIFHGELLNNQRVLS